MVWVVVANSNDCRIYHLQKIPAQIKLLKELSQPENRLKISDITSEKPGHYQSSNSARGTYSPHTDPKQVEYDHFARLICTELNEGRNANQFDELIIIAEPHMHGLIDQHLDKHVKSMVVHDLQKNIVHLNEHELLEYILKHTRYSGENK